MWERIAGAHRVTVCWPQLRSVYFASANFTLPRLTSVQDSLVKSFLSHPHSTEFTRSTSSSTQRFAFFHASVKASITMKLTKRAPHVDPPASRCHLLSAPAKIRLAIYRYIAPQAFLPYTQHTAVPGRRCYRVVGLRVEVCVDGCQRA
jgi:hypothetical protein